MITKKFILMKAMYLNQCKTMDNMNGMVAGLSAIDGVRLLGAPRLRTSTVSFVVDGHTPTALAAHLAGEGIAVWDGDNYAYELMSRYGLAETGGAIRASIVLYTTAEEIDRLVAAVAAVAGR